MRSSATQRMVIIVIAVLIVGALVLGSVGVLVG